MVINSVFSSEGGKFFYNYLLCFITNYYISTKTNLASAGGTRAASGHRRRPGVVLCRPTQICISARPFAAAGHELEPGPGRGRIHVGGIEGGRWWACWPNTFWLERWLLSLQPPPLPLFPTHPSLIRTRVSSRVPSFSRLRHVSWLVTPPGSAGPRP